MAKQAQALKLPFDYYAVPGADHHNYLPKAQTYLATRLKQDRVGQKFNETFDFKAYAASLVNSK
jgi:hypothetical protein